MLEPGSSILPGPAWPGQRAAIMDRHVARGEYIRRSSTSENYMRRHHGPRAALPRETGDIDPVLATSVYSTDDNGNDLMIKSTALVQRVASALRKRRISELACKDSGPDLSRLPSPTKTVDQTPSGTGRAAVQPPRRRAFSRTLTVAERPLTVAQSQIRSVILTTDGPIILYLNPEYLGSLRLYRQGPSSVATSRSRGQSISPRCLFRSLLRPNLKGRSGGTILLH